MSYYIGVDVGTGSVRAGLVNQSGQIVKTKRKDIEVNNPKPDFYQQSSSEIWNAVIETILAVLEGQDKAKVRGIGFDATCSLVVIGPHDKGLSIDPDSPASAYDVIMWMDHRAKKETLEINLTGHQVLKFVGGEVSVEMQTPKLLWIKNHLPEVWKKAKHFLDLSDYLVWKATGSLTRSLCSTVCKWTYQVDQNSGKILGWNEDYFNQIGLGDLVEDKFTRIGTNVASPGDSLGFLNEEAQKDFGLSHNVNVGASMIDAHAGALGMLACKSARKLCQPVNQLGLVSGTSTCHMALSRDPNFVPGVWGPYFSALLPGLWLLEGGQTAVGSLLDHITESHPAFEQAASDAKKKGLSIHSYLEDVLKSETERLRLTNSAFLTRNLHVWPDFHGNRAPLADPEMTGMVCGLSLDKTVSNLALLYLATIQSVSYGTRHIIEVMEKNGLDIKVLTVCGGLSKSSLYIQTHSDVLGRKVIRPYESDVVILGAAMLGACASVPNARQNPGESVLETILGEMGGEGDTFEPKKELFNFHEKKYQVFLKMGENQITYKKIMAS